MIRTKRNVFLRNVQLLGQRNNSSFELGSYSIHEIGTTLHGALSTVHTALQPGIMSGARKIMADNLEFTACLPHGQVNCFLMFIL